MINNDRVGNESEGLKEREREYQSNFGYILYRYVCICTQ
jgi:hypothetical protein